MKFSAPFFGCMLAVLLCAGLSGCAPGGSGQIEEEKEPHFIEGKRAVNGYDFEGAIDEFEKAVQANPRNASAHFELGWLYEEKQQPPDPAAAIYHYEQFLKLRPNADTAEPVRQRIMNCKQDLAKAVLPLPTTPGVQRDLEQLIEENKQLRAEVDQWRAYFKAQTNRPAQPPQSGPTLQTGGATAPTNVVSVVTNGVSHPAGTRPPGAHIYVVQSGDTLASISRKYNVKLDSIASANPGVEARKLRVGQVINIP